MPHPVFNLEQFTATKWDTAEDKVKFCKQFVRLVEGGFKETLFSKWFYTRLSMTFSHIAHYNQGGFYETQFGSVYAQADFLRHTLRYQACGDPTYTYVDAERAIQTWLTESGWVEKYNTLAFTAQEGSERAILKSLKQKYEPSEKGA